MSTSEPIAFRVCSGGRVTVVESKTPGSVNVCIDGYHILRLTPGQPIERISRREGHGIPCDGSGRALVDGEAEANGELADAIFFGNYMLRLTTQEVLGLDAFLRFDAPLDPHGHVVQKVERLADRVENHGA